MQLFCATAFDPILAQAFQEQPDPRWAAIARSVRPVRPGHVVLKVWLLFSNSGPKCS